MRLGQRLAAPARPRVLSEREILDDDFWRFDLRYRDHRGTVRRTHRPDLGVHTLSGPVAIEVELQPKTAARLRGICWMYAQLSEDDAPLNGAIYVTDRQDVARLVSRNAVSMGLDSLRGLTLDEIIEQTRTAADTVSPIRHRPSARCDPAHQLLATGALVRGGSPASTE